MSKPTQEQIDEIVNELDDGNHWDYSEIRDEVDKAIELTWQKAQDEILDKIYERNRDTINQIANPKFSDDKMYNLGQNDVCKAQNKWIDAMRNRKDVKK